MNVIEVETIIATSRKILVRLIFLWFDFICYYSDEIVVSIYLEDALVFAKKPIVIRLIHILLEIIMYGFYL